MINKVEKRKKRHLKVRKKIFGSCARPRLCVFKSSNHVYAQVINDENGTTLCSFSTVKLKDDGIKNKGNMHFAEIVGKKIAEIMLEKGIKTIVFDRNGYLYHGAVRALADGARSGGINF